MDPTALSLEIFTTGDRWKAIPKLPRALVDGQPPTVALVRVRCQFRKVGDLQLGFTLDSDDAGDRDAAIEILDAGTWEIQAAASQVTLAPGRWIRDIEYYAADLPDLPLTLYRGDVDIKGQVTQPRPAPPPTSPPVFTTDPTITGGAGLTATLFGNIGAATAAQSFARQWQSKLEAGSYADTGISTPNYSAPRVDGETVRLKVTASNVIGDTVRYSNEITAVAVETDNYPTFSSGSRLVFSSGNRLTFSS